MMTRTLAFALVAVILVALLVLLSYLSAAQFVRSATQSARDAAATIRERDAGLTDVESPEEWISHATWQGHADLPRLAAFLAEPSVLSPRTDKETQ